MFASFFFFFNDTATTEIYTLSLHDALPISCQPDFPFCARGGRPPAQLVFERDQLPDQGLAGPAQDSHGDRKSTRLNSSHDQISYAVFCLKKKKCIRTASTSTTRAHSLQL